MFDAGVNFVNKLLELHRDVRDKTDYRERILNLIEVSYYKRFVDTYAKLVDPTIVDPSRRDVVLEILKDLRLGSIPDKYILVYKRYVNGTVKFREYFLKELIKDRYKIDDDAASRILGEISGSHLILYKSYYNDLVSQVLYSQMRL